MQFITETIIDEAIAHFEDNEEGYDNALLELTQQQPAVTNYLLSEDFDSLTEDEKEIMLYMSIVIYHSIKKLYPEIEALSLDDIESAEDSNWGLLENVTDKKFSDRLNVFFNDSEQEDLLAFLEDVLVEEEELITKEGKEPMFIALKSIIDSFEEILD
jgi:hypothetical protein